MREERDVTEYFDCILGCFDPVCDDTRYRLGLCHFVGIQGKRVLPAVTGLLTGHLMAALIVAAGVGTLVTSQPVLLQVLTGVGAVYLLWMGLSLSMRPASISSDQVTIASSKSWYIRGVYLSGLNPKVLLLFLALLPPFIDPQAALSPTSQIVLLAGIHLMSCAAVYFLVGFSAQKVLGTRPAGC